VKFRGAVLTKDFSILRYFPFEKYSNLHETLSGKLITQVKRFQRLNEHDAHKKRIKR